MDKLLLRTIIALGLCAFASHVKRQYHFVYDRKNYTEALHYCREKYIDLATIDSMEDVEILNKMAELDKMMYGHYTYSFRAWIGLYDDVDSWRWSLSGTSFYKDGETEFRKWEGAEPNNFNSVEHCGAMSYWGYWMDLDCQRHFMGVCMDVTGSNVTFVRTSSTMTWPEAQSYCRANHTDLASVRNEEDNVKVHKVVPYGYKLWIGLYRETWKWLDGSNQSFQYWEEPEQPNNKNRDETCVSANFANSGKWEDWSCTNTRASICNSLASVSWQVMKVKLKMKNSYVDPNDPVVMENMLKKLKQRLKDQGLNENVKLSWRKQPDGKVFHKEKKKTESDYCTKTEL